MNEHGETDLGDVADRVLPWLRRPLWWGLSRGRWILCAVLAVLAVVLWLVGQHWLGYALGTLGLPWRLPRPSATYDTPDDAARARDALRASEAAQERDAVLARIQAESQAREQEAAQAAQERPISELVREHNAERARERKP